MVLKPKLETFEKNMIDVQMKKLKALQRKSRALQRAIEKEKDSEETRNFYN